MHSRLLGSGLVFLAQVTFCLARPKGEAQYTDTLIHAPDQSRFLQFIADSPFGLVRLDALLPPSLSLSLHLFHLTKFQSDFGNFKFLSRVNFFCGGRRT